MSLCMCKYVAHYVCMSLWKPEEGIRSLELGSQALVSCLMGMGAEDWTQASATEPSLRAQELSSVTPLCNPWLVIAMGVKPKSLTHAGTFEGLVTLKSLGVEDERKRARETKD